MDKRKKFIKGLIAGLALTAAGTAVGKNYIDSKADNNLDKSQYISTFEDLLLADEDFINQKGLNKSDIEILLNDQKELKNGSTRNIDDIAREINAKSIYLIKGEILKALKLANSGLNDLNDKDLTLKAGEPDGYDTRISVNRGYRGNVILKPSEGVRGAIEGIADNLQDVEVNRSGCLKALEAIEECLTKDISIIYTYTYTDNNFGMKENYEMIEVPILREDINSHPIQENVEIPAVGLAEHWNKETEKQEPAGPSVGLGTILATWNEDGREEGESK